MGSTPRGGGRGTFQSRPQCAYPIYLSNTNVLFLTILLFKTYVQEHPQYEEHQLTRNKELEAVLEPKEGEEVVLYEVLDKDIKTSASKKKSHCNDSQTEEPTEVCSFL